jgi:hypothetical protein
VPVDAGKDVGGIEMGARADGTTPPSITRIYEKSARRLALDGDHVFTIAGRPDDLVRMSKSGADPTGLNVAGPTALVATQGGVHYLTATAVAFLPREAGAAITLAGDQHYPGDLHVAEARVCWTSQVSSNDPSTRAILCQRRGAVDAGTELWQEARGIGRILLDGEGLAFIRDEKVVLLLDSPSAKPRELANVADADDLIGADARGIYVLSKGTYDGAVWRVPRNGSTAERLVHIGERVGCALVDREDVYVTSYHHQPGDLFGHAAALGTLSHHRLGTPSAEPIASGLSLCLGMAVDQHHVYVAGYEGISRANR